MNKVSWLIGKLIWTSWKWNGNLLQCSCLENPRDGGAWWAAVCGVAQSRTRLKRLSSSSSSSYTIRKEVGQITEILVQTKYNTWIKLGSRLIFWQTVKCLCHYFSATLFHHLIPFPFSRFNFAISETYFLYKRLSKFIAAQTTSRILLENFWGH